MKFLVLGFLFLTSNLLFADYTEECKKNHTKELDVQINNKLFREVESKAVEYFLNVFSNSNIEIEKSDITFLNLDNSNEEKWTYKYQVLAPLKTYLFSIELDEGWNGYGLNKIWNVSGADDAVYNSVGDLVSPATHFICKAIKDYPNELNVINLETGLNIGEIEISDWFHGEIIVPL